MSRNNTLFRSEKILVNSNNTKYKYITSANETIYSGYIYKLLVTGDIEAIQLTSQVDFADYPDSVCVFGCLILKTNV